jgi:hypothetical protein
MSLKPRLSAGFSHSAYLMRYFLRAARRQAGPLLAVEFPSPCDGSESGIRRSVFGRLVQVRTPSPTKECNLYRAYGVHNVSLGYICSSWENPSRLQSVVAHSPRFGFRFGFVTVTACPVELEGCRWRGLQSSRAEFFDSPK